MAIKTEKQKIALKVLFAKWHRRNPALEFDCMKKKFSGNFLDASMHLYKRPCLSVDRSVGFDLPIGWMKESRNLLARHALHAMTRLLSGSLL